MSGLKCAASVGWNVAKCFLILIIGFERLLFVICYMHIMHMCHADVWSWVSLSESASSTRGGVGAIGVVQLQWRGVELDGRTR